MATKNNSHNMKTVLTDKALNEIRTDSNLRAKLMLVEGKSEYTIKRWIDPEEQNDSLTKPKYTSVIAAHTGLTEDQILKSETISELNVSEG